MAIKTVDVTVPGGDTPRSANIKVNENFSDQSHAASRLVGTANGQVPLVEQVPGLLGTAAIENVGTAAGNVMQVGAFGLGLSEVSTRNNGLSPSQDTRSSDAFQKSGFTSWSEFDEVNYGAGISWSTSAKSTHQIVGGVFGIGLYHVTCSNNDKPASERIIKAKEILTKGDGGNTTQDSNGFLKGASPIAEIYSDRMDLNHDAIEQGGITFEKLGVGDYLVKGSLGFAQEGWYIETPKDANGNVLVAVVYTQLENNDLSIKTYAKRFDEESGDIVPNLSKPRDIPTGRFISLRLHELPTQDTSADASAQTNNL